MKKRFLLFCLSMMISLQSYAADLIEVYQQALLSDPVYQQNIATALALGENVYISLSSLLPNIGATVKPYLLRSLSSGPANRFIPTDRRRGYNLDLTITQTLFNFSQFSNLAQSRASAKQARATLNAAAQDLMVRVARAYFQVLEAEDNVRSTQSSKVAFYGQLDQINQQYKVGIKTITDVYTAQASYEISVADLIAAKTALANDRENLRAITGVLYPALAKLSEKFPLITPQPANMELWVDTSVKQNWQVKAAQYGAEAAKQNINQQFAGHLPTVNIQGSYDIAFQRAFGGATRQITEIPPGAGTTHTSTVSANVDVPLFEGGLVLAQTRQAKDNYHVALQQLEQQLRSSMNITRQSYLGVIAGISKITADKKAIQSSTSSYNGMEAGYRVGTEVLVNVLNQQQQILANRKQYAHDRYAYVNNLLALKQAAGILCPEDLAAINSWLYDGEIIGPEIPVEAIKKPKKNRKKIKNHT